MPRNLPLAFVFSGLVLASHAFADDAADELKRFQGRWAITDLIDNGRAVAPDLIKNWLPSGGQIEIVDNTILFTSPLDNKKRAKVLAIDPAVYPKTISIATDGQLEGWGIYRFDDQRVVLCLSDPAATPRPSEFSAHAGSNRMLMVLQPAGALNPAATPVANQPVTTITNPPATPLTLPNPPATPPATPLNLPAPPSQVPPATGVAAKVLTDTEVTVLMRGKWKLEDSLGALYVTFDPNGTFVTYREVQEASTFHRVFVQTPTSNGNWSVREGQLQAQVTGSVQISRVNQVLIFAIRSISDKDLLFVDPFGRVGKAIRVP